MYHVDNRHAAIDSDGSLLSMIYAICIDDGAAAAARSILVLGDASCDDVKYFLVDIIQFHLEVCWQSFRSYFFA